VKTAPLVAIAGYHAETGGICPALFPHDVTTNWVLMFLLNQLPILRSCQRPMRLSTIRLGNNSGAIGGAP
jgi:hypothetical protein